MPIDRTVILISGMKSNRCREAIVRALESVAGVRDVDVNLFRAWAAVVHEPPCTVPRLIQAIADAGYDAALRTDD